MKTVIITIGEYEDREVLGLYRTNYDIDIQFLKEKQIAYSKFLGVYSRSLSDSIMSKSSVDRFYLERIYHEHIAGYPKPEYLDTRNYKVYRSSLDDFNEKLESSGAEKVDLIEWLCSEGVMHKVDFCEVSMSGY